MSRNFCSTCGGWVGIGDHASTPECACEKPFAVPNRLYQQGPAAPTHIEVHDNATGDRVLVPTAALVVREDKDERVRVSMDGHSPFIVTDSFDDIARALGAVVVTP